MGVTPRHTRSTLMEGLRRAPARTPQAAGTSAPEGAAASWSKRYDPLLCHGVGRTMGSEVCIGWAASAVTPGRRSLEWTSSRAGGNGAGRG